MRNFYQYLTSKHEFDFPISSQAHNGQKSIRNQQLPNNNLAIIQSNLVIAKAMRLTPKQSNCMIKYNGNSDASSDNNIEFVDINLPCNKLSI